MKLKRSSRYTASLEGLEVLTLFGMKVRGVDQMGEPKEDETWCNVGISVGELEMSTLCSDWGQEKLRQEKDRAE